MSIPVTIEQLPARLDDYVNDCFLITVGSDGTPKVVHVPVAMEGREIRCTPGGGTLRNLATGGPVTLIFPPPGVGAHSMLVDGTGSVVAADEPTEIAISFDSGILHRPPSSLVC